MLTLVRSLIALVALSCALAPVFAGESPLGPETQANTYTDSDQSDPAVATTAGGFVVVWQSYEQDDGYAGIYGQRYATDGSADGAEFQVSTIHYGYQQYLPDVSADAAGRFVVTWLSYYESGPYFNVQAHRYDADGASIGAEFQANSGPTTLCDGDYPQPAPLSVAPTSEFVVTWANCYTDDQNDIYARRFDPADAPLAVEFQVNGHTAGDQTEPALAHDAAGNFVVVWTSDDSPPTATQDGDGKGVFGQRFDQTGAMTGAEFQVNTGTAGDQYEPDVAFTSGGSFVVVWTSFRPGDSAADVFGQRFAASGERIGDEFQVNLYTPGLQIAPRVAADSNGGFVVVWSSRGQDGDDEGIFGRRYDDSGIPAAREFIANATTAGAQSQPVVAALSATNFLVAWTSEGQDGDGAGIFARRFGHTAPPASCIGDCNHNAAVTVDELLTSLRIALGRQSLAACEAADHDHDGTITVDEVIQAIATARTGCD